MCFSHLFSCSWSLWLLLHYSSAAERLSVLFLTAPVPIYLYALFISPSQEYGTNTRGYWGLNTFMSPSQATLSRHKYHFSKGATISVLLDLCLSVLAHMCTLALHCSWCSSNVLLEECVCRCACLCLVNMYACPLVSIQVLAGVCVCAHTCYFQ